jgi:hypothetical protein
MSHKTRRQQFLKQQERQRIRQEPVLPPEAPTHDPYDFGLFQPEPNPEPIEELIRQQRRTASAIEFGTSMALVQDLRRRFETPRPSWPTPSISTMYQTQALMSPIFQELQYRELYQIHKALNGGVYLP